MNRNLAAWRMFTWVLCFSFSAGAGAATGNSTDGEQAPSSVDANQKSSQLEEVKVFGRRIEEKKTDLSSDAAAGPASVTVVDQKTLSNEVVNSYGDIFLPIAGLAVSNFGQGGLSYGFELRGFPVGNHGGDVAVQIDGLPTNQDSGQQFNGYDDLQPLIPEVIQSVAIIRGFASPYFGQDSEGGSIAIKTADALPSNLLVSGGSFGTERVLGTYGYSNGKVSGYSANEFFNTDGYRDNSQLRQYNSFNKVTFPLLDSTASVRFQIYSAPSYGAPGYIEEGLIRQGVISPKTPANPTDGGAEQQQNLVFNYQSPDAHNYWATNAYLLNDKLKRISSFGAQTYQLQRLTTYGGELHRNLPFDIGTMPTELALGVGLRDYRVGGITQPTDQMGNPRPVDFTNLSNNTNREVTVYNPNVFVSWQLKPVDALKVTVGGRFDRFYYHLLTRPDDASPDLDLHPNTSIFSPKGGLAYSVTDTVQVYANAARGFKARSGMDELISDPDLKPSRLTGYEAGVVTGAPNGRFSFKADVFITTQSAELAFNAATNQNISLGNTKRVGGDLEARYYLTQDFSVFGNYSPLHARLESAPANNLYVTSVPEYTATLGLDYALGIGDHRFITDLFDTMTGHQRLDVVAGAYTTTPYAQLHAKLTYVNARLPGFSSFVSAAYFPDSRFNEIVFLAGNPAGMNVPFTSPQPPFMLNGGITYQF